MSAITFRTERAIPSTSPTASDTPAPAGTGVMRYPSLTTTVPKEFVHRASVAEVMLTDWERTGQARFTVSAQWPRGHSFFTPSKAATTRSSRPRPSARPAHSWHMPNSVSRSATTS